MATPRSASTGPATRPPGSRVPRSPVRRLPVLTTVREVYAAAGTAVLLAGHDPVVVADADRVVRLSDGQVIES